MSIKIIALDIQSRYLGSKIVAIGGLNDVAADPKVIFKYLLDIGATKCIFAHNHPNGDITPSSGDRSKTAQFIDAAQALEIEVLDHIIVSPNGDYFSFKEELNEKETFKANNIHSLGLKRKTYII